MVRPTFWRIRDQAIEYQLTGAHFRDQPLYLLLHEGLGCVDLWRDFPSTLSQALGAPVLAYSRIGYGRSAPVSLPRPVSYMHDEADLWLTEVIDQLTADNIRLIGHSDGASIALIYLAGEHHRRHRRVDMAFCLAPHVFVEPVTIASIEAAAQRFDTSDLPQRLKRYHHDNTENAFRGWCDAWLSPAFRDWDLTALLPQIDTPLHVIQGEDDEYGSAEQPRTIAELTAGRCEISMLNHCAHAPQFDQPEQTIQIIRTASELL